MNTARRNKKKLRIVVDTNIVISALNFGGNPLKVLLYALGGNAEVCLSQFILDEIYRVLSTKFPWKKSQADRIRQLLYKSTRIVVPTERVSVVRDEADNRILECALAARAEYIVSGDDDLLSLRRFSGIRVITATKFLEIIANP